MFVTEEMELNNIPYLLTTNLSYLNDEPSKVVTPLPNLEHDLGVDNNDIDNYMPLPDFLFLEEEQISTLSLKMLMIYT